MSIKWDSYLSILVFTIVGTIPFTIISYTGFLWDDEPTLTEGINVIFYILIWLVISVYMGYVQQKRFRKFSLIYFSILFLSSILAKVPSLGLFIPIVLGLGGTYTGLGYYIDMGPNLFIWGPLFTLILIISGYYTGAFLKAKGTKKLLC